MKKNVNRIRHHVNPLADRTEHTFNGFGNDKSIIIDVGAEQGEFTAGLLEQFGNAKNFVVFEIRKPLAEKLRVKFQENENVVVFDGDASRNFKNIVKPCIEEGAGIEEIYVNFPDPWFKDRHKKRRFVNEDFLNTCKTYISPATKWVFQTDQEKLFGDTCDMLQEVGVNTVLLVDDVPHGIATRWENAKIGEGKKIFRLSFHL